MNLFKFLFWLWGSMLLNDFSSSTLEFFSSNIYLIWIYILTRVTFLLAINRQLKFIFKFFLFLIIISLSMICINAKSKRLKFEIIRKFLLMIWKFHDYLFFIHSLINCPAIDCRFEILNTFSILIFFIPSTSWSSIVNQLQHNF